MYGVPLVYARGRTYIDGLFSCVYGVGSLSCLYGVPLMFFLFVLPLLGVFHLCMAYSVHVVTV